MFGEAALAGLREDAVDLGQRQSLDRIVLVDVDGQAIQGDADPRRLEAVLLLEGVFLLGLHLARHRPKLGRACGQGRRGGGRSLAFDLNLHVRIELVERLGPIGHQVVQRVGADAVEAAVHARHLLVALDRGIDRLLGATRLPCRTASAPRPRIAPRTTALRPRFHKRLHRRPSYCVCVKSPTLPHRSLRVAR